MMRDPFIGVGPGRCGSHTLNKIIGACKNVHSYHEAAQVPWYDGGGHEQLGKLIRRFREHRELGMLSGDISPSLIRQIPNLRSAYPGLKVICLHRARHEVVKSFLAYGRDMPPLRPLERERWADSCMGPDRIDAGVVKCFPVIDAATREQSIGFYWDMYEELMFHVKQPVFHLKTDLLNDRTTIDNLFNFLDMPSHDRVFIEVKRFWSGEEVEDAYRQLRGQQRYA